MRSLAHGASRSNNLWSGEWPDNGHKICSRLLSQRSIIPVSCRSFYFRVVKTVQSPSKFGVNVQRKGDHRLHKATCLSVFSLVCFQPACFLGLNNLITIQFNSILFNKLSTSSPICNASMWSCANVITCDLINRGNEKTHWTFIDWQLNELLLFSSQHKYA